MIKNQFIHFINQFKDKRLNIYNTKIINIILENFNEVVDKSKSKRISFIANIIKNNIDDIDVKLKEIEVNEKGSEDNKIIKLTKLDIENFRGYSIQQNFIFDKQYSIIFGGNGTGKTSFAEALEYSLIGGVLEAKERKIEDRKYIGNQFVKKVTHPYLSGINEIGNEIQVNADENYYHFCFIEKNRIDNFSRIDTIGPENSKKQLGKLFGINNFNNFIIDFNGNIEDKLIRKIETNDNINMLHHYERELKKADIEYSNIDELINTINNIKDKEDINYKKKDELNLSIAEESTKIDKIENPSKMKYLIIWIILNIIVIVSILINFINIPLGVIVFIIFTIALFIYSKISIKQGIKNIPSIKENIKNIKEEIKSIKSYRDIIDIGNNFIELEKKERVTLSKIKEIDENNLEMQGYIKAYDELKTSLNTYKDNLYLSIIEDLEINIIEFYNKIIKNDIESKKLKSIKIPKIGEDEIIIELENNQKHNALSILNEGHLKILGLSILLAKANLDKLPFLILDDIVNSIDDKFRNGIIDLIFKDDKFSNTQIILATHSGKFQEVIVNTPEIRDKTKLFLLTKNNGVIYLEEEIGSFLDKGKNFLDKGLNKDALHNLRLGLELILSMYWKKLGGFSLKIKELGKIPDIKKPDKVIKIIKELEKRISEKKDKEGVYYNVLSVFNTYFDRVSCGASRELKFTNKGSHIIESEEEEDLNSTDILELYTNLIELEKLFKKIK